MLHHLPDPDLGLRSLRAALARDGALHIMVYAAYGRAGVSMMQEYCRLLGIGRGWRGIADACGDDRLAFRGPSLGRRCEPSEGLREQPNALADALLHPVDRAYTVSQLHAWIERCGLKFARWYEQAPYLPQCGAIAGMPHAARLASLPPPTRHAAVELLRGTMTKHDFIAYRDDRVGESQPIAFDGERWLGYVALRLPWTLIVRERLPSGAAAALINRAHPYPDLALPINAAQDRVFAAIDGKRTVEEILRGAGERLTSTRAASSSNGSGATIKSCWTRQAHVDDCSRGTLYCTPMISAGWAGARQRVAGPRHQRGRRCHRLAGADRDRPRRLLKPLFAAFGRCLLPQMDMFNPTRGFVSVAGSSPA